eukprot:TRINITY_DN27591_c0_g1_i1.p1 TRINITY_DN27591_c0_g1~~TRINITY_DN27591_c0_g1_i1.p1  ORF type:complete len:173 (-),score=62.89 TRINITY_DN27591_c0_g1_i1:76-594(-)
MLPPLKVGAVVIGVFYLLMGFIYCITVELEYVKEAKVEGLGFYEDWIEALLFGSGNVEVNKTALMAAFVIKIVFASLDILVGVCLLLLGSWPQMFALVLIPVALTLNWIQKIFIMYGTEDNKLNVEIVASLILILALTTMVNGYCWVCVYSYLEVVKKEKKEQPVSDYFKYL